jgi:hypothetical protein
MLPVASVEQHRLGIQLYDVPTGRVLGIRVHWGGGGVLKLNACGLTVIRGEIVKKGVEL